MYKDLYSKDQTIVILEFLTFDNDKLKAAFSGNQTYHHIFLKR